MDINTILEHIKELKQEHEALIGVGISQASKHYHDGAFNTLTFLKQWIEAQLKKEMR